MGESRSRRVELPGALGFLALAASSCSAPPEHGHAVHIIGGLWESGDDFYDGSSSSLVFGAEVWLDDGEDAIEFDLGLHYSRAEVDFGAGISSSLDTLQVTGGFHSGLSLAGGVVEPFVGAGGALLLLREEVALTDTATQVGIVPGIYVKAGALFRLGEKLLLGLEIRGLASPETELLGDVDPSYVAALLHLGFSIP